MKSRQVASDAHIAEVIYDASPLIGERVPLTTAYSGSV